MPRKPKPSKWQRGGVELLEVDHLYPDDLMVRLAKFVGSPTGERFEEFKTTVLNIAAMLNADLHFEGRPTIPEIHVALDRITRRLTEMQSVLRGLDPDTRALLCKIAEGDPWNQQLEPPAGIVSLGELRVGRVLDDLDKLAQWLRGARAATGEGKLGRRRKDVIKQAVAHLRDLWTRFVKKEPTLISNQRTKKTSGAFLDFWKIALEPVLSARGATAGKEHVARIVLYGEKPPRKRGKLNP